MNNQAQMFDQKWTLSRTLSPLDENTFSICVSALITSLANINDTLVESRYSPFNNKQMMLIWMGHFIMSNCREPGGNTTHNTFTLVVYWRRASLNLLSGPIFNWFALFENGLPFSCCLLMSSLTQNSVSEWCDTKNSALK